MIEKPTRREAIAGVAAVAGALMAPQGLAAQGTTSTRTRAGGGAFANVKLLVFDTFGTVVDWRSVVIEEGQALSKAKGFSLDWAAFADERDAVVLVHVLGYKVESGDPDEDTAATRCKCTGRTIRNRLMRAAAKLSRFKEAM